MLLDYGMIPPDLLPPDNCNMNSILNWILVKKSSSASPRQYAVQPSGRSFTGLVRLLLAGQVIYSFEEDGGIGKMVSNKIAIGLRGEWLLPFWREMGGQYCKQAPAMHGRAGVLISEDKAI